MPSRTGVVAVAIAIAFLLAWPCRVGRAQELAFRHFAREQGLPNFDVSCLVQDRIGFIYACTDGGVFRFDGARFQPYGADAGMPAEGVARNFLITQGGRQWAVFADGIYARVGDRFVEAVPVPEPGRHMSSFDLEPTDASAVLGEDLVQIIDGRLMRVHVDAGGQPVIARMLSPAIEAGFAGLTNIASVYADGGTLWAGCGASICRIAAGGVQVYANPVPGRAHGARHDPVDAGIVWRAFLRDRQGTLWARSGGLLAQMAPGASSFTTLAIPGGSGSFAGDTGYLRLVEDASGGIVTQSPNGIVVRRGARWSAYDHADGVPRGVIATMMFDRTHRLWLGNRGEGVHSAAGLDQWESLTRASGMTSDTIWDMTSDHAGTMWVAGDDGVDAIGSSDVVQRAHGRTGASYTVAVTRGGAVISGVLGRGIMRREPSTGRTRLLAPIDGVEDLCVDRTGRLWIGTDKGLFSIADPDGTGSVAALQAELPGQRIHVVREDRNGDIWILGRSALLHRDRSGHWHEIVGTTVHGGGGMRALAFPADGSVWIGGGPGGIVRLRVADERVVARQQIEPPSIMSRNVLALHADGKGRVWVGSDQGVDMFDGRLWRHFNEDDGLLSNDIDEGAIAEGPDGTLWFGTSKGLAHFIGANRLPALLAPRAIITEATIGKRSLASSGAVTLPWTTDPLVIRFSALDARHDSTLRFRYRLFGVDHDWAETEERQVRYAGLPKGKQRFEVVAFDPVDGLTSAPVSFSFRMRAPWWQSWPFYACSGATLAAVLAGAWQLRVRFLLTRQRQLELLVRARTREIETARQALVLQASIDSLTGLMNRPTILAVLAREMEHARATCVPMAVGLIDLDHFKRINDSWGHLAGDAVLGEAGARLAAATGTNAQVGRYGGEELLAVFPGLPVGNAAPIEALRARLTETPFDIAGASITVTCSIGVTWFVSSDSLHCVIDRADAALYRAKRNGRDRVECEIEPLHTASAA